MRRSPLLLTLAALAGSALVVAAWTGAFDGWFGAGRPGAAGAATGLDAEGGTGTPGATPNGAPGTDDEPAPLDPVAADVGKRAGSSGADPSAAGSEGGSGGGVSATADGSGASKAGRRGGTTGARGSGKGRAAGTAGATNPDGTTDAPEVKTGSISGRVVRRSDGLVITGARIRAFPHNRGPDQAKWEAEAGEDGTFVINAVPVGRYGVEASYGGHAPEVVAGVEVTEDGDTALGDLVLANGALLQGRVTGADGQPREGLTLRVFGVQQGVREGTTAPDGSYRLAGLAPANYFVEIRGATAPDRFPVRIVTLALGEARRLDFETTPGVALTVTVLRGGAPVAQADVRFVTRAGTFGDVGLKLDDVETDVVKTDDAGQVRFADLAPGPYDLIVRHRDRNDEGKPAGPWRALQHSFVIPEDGGRAMALELRYPTAEVTGMVVHAVTGEPIGGARVVLETAELRASRSLADKLIAANYSYGGSGGDGVFRFPHVTPDTYSLTVVKAGFAARSYTGVGVGPDGLQGMRIELTPGEAVLELTLQVGAERAVQGSFAVLRDADGADVGLHGIPLEGTVQFTGLAAGTHTLLCYVPNEPVIVRTGIALVAGETTALTVVVPE
ncbi:MAG: carboxypeptidase-like regulatory domain-containing protein [Planctomycetota bacterium]|jgi:hypothetical protein